MNRKMLKLIAASKNPKDSPIGFNPIDRALARDYKPALEEANMAAIEKALSFHNCTWKFLVDSDGPGSKAAREGMPLNFSFPGGADLCVIMP